MLAVQLVSRIGKELGTKVPVHRLYENPSIGLARRLLEDA